MTVVHVRYVVLSLVVVFGATDVSAQVWKGSAGPRPGAVEISGGGMWSAGQDLDDRAAVLTANPGTGSSAFELFTSEPTVKPVFGAQLLVGYYVTRAFAVEGGMQYSRPKLSVRLGEDFEDAPAVTATTEITQYLFTGSAVYHFGNSPRMAPFIAVGAGHLRDVHNGDELIDSGVEYHGKFGLKYWSGSGRGRIGLRAEGGVSARRGGFNFDEDRRMIPTAAVSLAYLF